MDALSEEEINIMQNLWEKVRSKYGHLTFGDVSKLVEFVTRIEDCRRRQKREKTRRRVHRWRQKKVETEESNVNKATPKVQSSRRSGRQRNRRRDKSGATGKSTRKRCKKQRKTK